MSGTSERDDPLSNDEEPRFDLTFKAPAGQVMRVSPLVRRLVAPNPGPFTFTGTCSYFVGAGEVALIDPGPDDPDHVEALLAAVPGEQIAKILVTHTHRDHSPAARAIQAATGAEIIGCAPHFPARDLALGETNKLDAANDLDHAPDRALADGDLIKGPGYSLRAIATPGHTMNHLCFELVEEKALFTGDHIMGWSTSIVAPPDGNMRLYLELARKTARLRSCGLLAGPWRPSGAAAAVSAGASASSARTRNLHPRSAGAGSARRAGHRDGRLCETRPAPAGRRSALNPRPPRRPLCERPGENRGRAAAWRSF